MESLEKDYLSLGQLYDGRDHTNPEKPTLFPRRQFVRMSAGTIGGLLASGLWLPATALAHSSPLITLNRGDLVGVKVRNTGTGSMEVHILTAASNYQQFSLHTGTPINEVDASDNFSFVRANKDILGVKSRNTGSGSMEVHILTAKSNYQKFSLHTATPINEVDASDNFSFANADRDLMCIKSRNTGTGSMEVHILTAASNYQQFSLHTGTPINEVDASDNFSFVTVTGRDLVCIKSRNTGSGMMEVHILTAASNYQQFSLHTATPINAVDASDNFSFTTVGRDLVCIKSRNTGTGSMEVHILTAASNYQQFSLHTGTPINEVDASDNFVFFCVN